MCCCSGISIRCPSCPARSKTPSSRTRRCVNGCTRGSSAASANWGEHWAACRLGTERWDAMLEGRDIVCFCNDWDGDPLSKKHVMLGLARKNRILWVNSIGNRNPRVTGRDLRLVVKKARDFAAGCRRVADNIYVFSPLVIPLHGSALARRFNRWFLAATLRRVCRQLAFRNVITWTFFPTSGDVVGELGERLVVYHCVDEYSEFTGTDKAAVAGMEERLLAKADVVIASSQLLYERKRRDNAPTFLVTHGVDVEHFRRACRSDTVVPDDLAALPRPVIGFYGLIADWVDLELFRFLAVSRPQWSFALIGRTQTDVGGLQGLPNVHLLGRKDYQLLPAYCKGFDVAILPFVKPFAVRREKLVVLATEQMHVRQALERADVRLRASDQREGPLWPRHREEPKQLQVHPIGDQSVESDHRPGQSGQVVRDHRIGATGAPEVLDIHAVCHQERRRVIASLALVQQLRRGDHHVGLREQPLLHPGDRGFVGAREFGVFVDAVVYDQPFAELAHDVPGRGEERPRDHIAKCQLPTHAAQRGGEEPTIEPPRECAAMERDHEGREDVDVVGDASATCGEISRLLDHQSQVPPGDARIAIADRVYPQDAILPREAEHHVFLAQGVAVPVVAEADDVSPFKHCVPPLRPESACRPMLSPVRRRSARSARTPVHTPPGPARRGLRSRGT